jgi:hypothetical protein
MSQPDQAEAVLIARGRFSVYETPDGSIRLAWRLDGSDEDGRFEVPAAAAQLMREHAANGTRPSPIKLLGLMRGLVGGRN